MDMESFLTAIGIKSTQPPAKVRWILVRDDDGGGANAGARFDYFAQTGTIELELHERMAGQSCVLAFAVTRGSSADDLVISPDDEQLFERFCETVHGMTVVDCSFATSERAPDS